MLAATTMNRHNIFYLENNLMADWNALKKATRRELAYLYSDAIQPSEEPAPLVLIWIWREVFERNTKVIKTWTKFLALLDNVSEALDLSASEEYEAITNENARFIDWLHVVQLIHRYNDLRIDYFVLGEEVMWRSALALWEPLR